MNSATTASGTPSLNNKIGHTLAATSPIRSPETIARKETGSLDQKLSERICIDRSFHKPSI
jgi:hypothetical protein